PRPPRMRMTDLDELHDIPARSRPAATQQASPLPTTAIPLPSSPTTSHHLPVPPNAPLLPFAVPPVHNSHHTNDGTHGPRLPQLSNRRISSLHSNGPSHDPRVPRSEDIIECLETLAYLSKY